MGLFDRLFKKTTDNIVPTKKEDSSKKEPKSPFSDETIEQYYNVIYGMSKSIDGEFLKSKKVFQIAKLYIETQLEIISDEEKVKKALELFKISRNNANDSEAAIFLREYNKQQKNTNPYVNKNFDVIGVCYQDEFNVIQSEYVEILDVIKENPRLDYFQQGVRKKILEAHSATIGKSETVQITQRIIKKSLYEGNPTIRQIFVELMFYITKHNPSVSQLISLKIIALRALNFEQYGNNRSQYRTITNDDYRNFAMRDKELKKEIAEHPFDKENYVERFVRKMSTNFVYDSSAYIGDVRLIDDDPYFLDYVCNLTWKESIRDRVWLNEEGRDIANSYDPIDVSDAIIAYYVKVYLESQK